jgi:hypothetical protein
MSTARNALRTFLLADTDIAAAVSTRAYPDIAPESATLPFLVLQTVAQEGIDSTQGQTGTYRQTVSVIVVAADSPSRDALVEHIRNRADGYRGQMSTTTVQACWLQSVAHDIDASPTAEANRRYVADCVFVLTVVIGAPTFS